jgi:signal peptide peptidase SppA
LWSIEPLAFESLRNRAAAFVKAAPGERPQRPLMRTGGGIAVIEIVGPMIKTPDWVDAMFGFTSTAGIRQAVEAAGADPAIAAIVLRVDSPGGSVDGMAELGDAIWEARQVKPVIAQVDGLAASAAYYAASQASRIYAGRMDMIGSLGARILLYDFSAAFAQMGVKAVPIDTSPEDRPFKSAAAPGTPITETQIDDFQRIVDAYGADFRAMLARGRGWTDAQVDRVFDGRVWTTPEAMTLGLVDGVRTLAETVAGEAERLSAPGRMRTAQAKAEAMARGMR